MLEFTPQDYDKIFNVNLKGLLFALQTGPGRWLSKVVTARSSPFPLRPGRRGEAVVLIYCASKATVISMSQSAGLELIQYKINVNGIAPGVIDTPMWDEVDALFAKYENRPIGDKKRLMGEAVPYGRMGRSEDMTTGAAVFLASSASDYVVAQTLNVDGGNWMS